MNSEQGIRRDATADAESFEALLEDSNSSEAGVVFGVENSKDPSVSEVTALEVPEDDVPGECINQDQSTTSRHGDLFFSNRNSFFTISAPQSV